MDQQVLEKLQEVETGILCDVHTYCRKHGIDYSLMYGTLIGAVRHHGPIPWDDDVDIIMDRKNYAKFIDSFAKEPIKGYFMQREGPDTGSRINHLKIRKDGTRLGNLSDFAHEEHSGIWVDVFVFDRVPVSNCKRRKVLLWNKIRMIYTRGYVPKKSGKLTRTAVKLMLSFPEKLKKKLRSKSEKKIRKYEDYTGEYELRCLASPDEAKYSFPAYSTDKFETIDYCGHQLCVSSYYDELLRIRYGDYMQFPPESERVCLHNPKVIEF